MGFCLIEHFLFQNIIYDFLFVFLRYNAYRVLLVSLMGSIDDVAIQASILRARTLEWFPFHICFFYLVLITIVVTEIVYQPQ